METPKFQFEIGELVYVKQGIENSLNQCKIGKATFPSTFMVVERHTQECPGGVQLHYTLSGGGGSQRLLEIELVKLDQFDVVNLFDILIAARQKADPLKWGPKE